jgi:hypothetical protein
MKNAIFVLLLLLAACVVQPPVVEKNITPTPAEGGAEYGDLLSINFVLTLENGTIVDTNNEEIANQYHIKNYVKGNYTFILGQSGKVKGFDEVLLEMNEGEHWEKIIEPSEKEVVFEINKTKVINRFITINKKQGFPRASYEAHFKKAPVVGDKVKAPEFAFTYKVLNVTNESVITEMVLKEGEEYVLPNTYWKSKVAKIAADDAMFYQQPEENQTVDAPFGKAIINMTKSRMFLNFQPELYRIFNKSVDVKGISLPQQFQVAEIKNDSFTIKRYGNLADKRLKLTADLVKRVKHVKDVKRSSIPLVTNVNDAGKAN